MMVGDEHRDNPVVSVLDGHSLALSFLGGALGAEQTCLGTDQFGQSGLPHEVYDALQIGQGAHRGCVPGGGGVRASSAHALMRGDALEHICDISNLTS